MLTFILLMLVGDTVHTKHEHLRITPAREEKRQHDWKHSLTANNTETPPWRALTRDIQTSDQGRKISAQKQRKPSGRPTKAHTYRASNNICRATFPTRNYNVPTQDTLSQSIPCRPQWKWNLRCEPKDAQQIQLMDNAAGNQSRTSHTHRPRYPSTFSTSRTQQTH
jgi:hypothetical protein